MTYTTEQIHQILIDCADTCVLPYFRNLQESDIHTKAHEQDFVTIADQKSEAYLTPILRNLVPNSFILGEEAFSEDNSRIEGLASYDDVWIIDPVDGTTNFKNGTDNFCIILAHAHKGRLIGTWIYAPILNKFAAWRQGENVTINAQPVSMDCTSKAIEDMLVGEHISYFRSQDREIIRTNRKAFKSHVSLGCFGIETIYMLENKVDALSFGAGNPWDISPCIAMINATGGKALKISGEEAIGNNLLTVKGAFLATRSPNQWQEVRDAMLKDVAWEKYFD